MTEKEEFNAIKDACLSSGGNLLLQDIDTNLKSTDTIKVMPLVDNGVVICTQSEQMLKQQGYVAALEWVKGIMEHYKNTEYKEYVQD